MRLDPIPPTSPPVYLVIPETCDFCVGFTSSSDFLPLLILESAEGLVLISSSVMTGFFPSTSKRCQSFFKQDLPTSFIASEPPLLDLSLGDGDDDDDDLRRYVDFCAVGFPTV